MFSEDRVLQPSTPRAVYPYCPFEDLIPSPLPIEVDGIDVGCLVDNIINSYSRTHVHPDDLYAILCCAFLVSHWCSVVIVNNNATMQAKVRWPIPPEWSDAWVAQVVNMTSIDYRVSLHSVAEISS